MNKKVNRNKVLSVSLLMFALVIFSISIVGTTNAWFTSENIFTNDGTMPYISVTLYNNQTIISSSANAPVSQYIELSSITASGQEFSSAVTFNLSGTTIDTLVRAKVVVNWFDGENILPNNNWLTIGSTNIGVVNNTTNWLSSDSYSGWHYYSSKIAKANVGSAITIFDKLTVNSADAVGKTAKVYIYVEVVQANDLGIDKLQDTSNNNYTLPAIYVHKGQTNSILG